MAKVFRIIPSLDTTDLAAACRIAEAVGGLDAVSGFKVGFGLALAHGLPTVAASLGTYTSKPLIYDHQKAGTDIPDTGDLFARTVREAGIDEVILFPQAGPVVLQAWVASCMAQGLKVIVGGLMTHRGYVRSEGGFIDDGAIVQMYRLAHAEGVRAFVVPLTRPAQTRAIVEEAALDGCEFYSPGYGAQGGDPGAFGFLARHFLIVGRALLSSPEPAAFVDSLVRDLQRYR